MCINREQQASQGKEGKEQMSRWGRALGPLGGWGLEGVRSLELPLALGAPAVSLQG